MSPLRRLYASISSCCFCNLSSYEYSNTAGISLVSLLSTFSGLVGKTKGFHNQICIDLQVILTILFALFNCVCMWISKFKFVSMFTHFLTVPPVYVFIVYVVHVYRQCVNFYTCLRKRNNLFSLHLNSLSRSFCIVDTSSPLVISLYFHKWVNQL